PLTITCWIITAGGEPKQTLFILIWRSDATDNPRGIVTSNAPTDASRPRDVAEPPSTTRSRAPFPNPLSVEVLPIIRILSRNRVAGITLCISSWTASSGPPHPPLVKFAPTQPVPGVHVGVTEASVIPSQPPLAVLKSNTCEKADGASALQIMVWKPKAPVPTSLFMC